MKIGVFKFSIILIFIALVAFLALWTIDNFHPFDNRSENSDPLRLVFVGDVMLSRDIGDIISRKGPEYPFEHVREILRSGDITMGNLESPISDLNISVCEKNAIYCFRSSPESLNSLVYGGFDIMTVANNHALDYGPEVLNDTLIRLAASGIEYTGVQQSEGNLTQDAVILHDPRMNVAFLGFNDIWLSHNVSQYPVSGYPRPWNTSKETVIEAVKRARGQADIVVVNIHFGKEMNFTHEKRQEELAHAAADAGADIIIGHHPHVLQYLEIYNQSVIAYSLGNFIFDIKGNGAREGAILTVEIDPKSKQIKGYSLEKVTANDEFQPRPGLTGMIISYYERAVSWSSKKLYSIIAMNAEFNFYFD